MELYQVRYFLALASTLNFTRAAELCCVTQPTLSRGIRALEDELGGSLISRERQFSHLTELGHRVLPILERTYKAALAAKALARTCSEVPSLRLAMTGSVDLSRIIIPLSDILTRFPNVEINVLRGSPEEILEHLKSGDADLVVSDIDIGSWERLDSWLVDRMPYSLIANRIHPFATHEPVVVRDIVGERLICLPYCSLARDLLDMTEQEGRKICQVSTLGDIFDLLKLNAGLALLPEATQLPADVVRIRTVGFPLEHATRLYAVAGRRWSKSAAVFISHFARVPQTLAESQSAVVIEPKTGVRRRLSDAA